MARVRVAEPAKAYIAENLKHLNREAGIQTAEMFARRFARLFDQLALHPESGSLQPCHGSERRLRVVTPYNVYSRYDAATDIVIVLRVLHGRRKITRGMMASKPPTS